MHTFVVPRKKSFFKSVVCLPGFLLFVLVSYACFQNCISLKLLARNVRKKSGEFGYALWHII